MVYFLQLFSPRTYDSFSKTDKSVSGVTDKNERKAREVVPGDYLICYVTNLSRWIGVLEVIGPMYRDETPVFLQEQDPFKIRFRVKPVVWLDLRHGIPVREEQSWNSLTFLKNLPRESKHWTGFFRTSLHKFSHEDGQNLVRLLSEQQEALLEFPLPLTKIRTIKSARPYKLPNSVREVLPVAQISEPMPPSDAAIETIERESIQIQALLCEIGEKLGYKIWVPRSDKGRVVLHWHPEDESSIGSLPNVFNEETIRTIEQIDVLWLRNRTIARAFEVEHSTSIYSGILRMADLLALQPNIDIKLHIVAPVIRRQKVFSEIQRPVFSLFEAKKLADVCTYISYEKVKELSQLPHLKFLKTSIVDEYAEVVA